MMLNTNKNILIVGLGLLGGSYAKALTRKGFNVKVITLKQEDIDYAIFNLEAKKKQYTRLLSTIKKECIAKEDFE